MTTSTWSPVPQVDRSMGREEYRYWRRRSRKLGRYGPLPYADATVYIPQDRAVATAGWDRIGRRLAIELRVYRNRVRRGMV